MKKQRKKSSSGSKRSPAKKQAHATPAKKTQHKKPRATPAKKPRITPEKNVPQKKPVVLVQAKQKHYKGSRSSGRKLRFTKGEPFFVGRITVVRQYKKETKKVRITNKKTKGGVYTRKVRRGNVVIETRRIYTTDRAAVLEFLKKQQSQFRKGKRLTDTISGMIQHVSGSVSNPFRGTLGKGSQAKKGAYLRSIALGELDGLTEREIIVLLNNRVSDADIELERIEQEYAIRYFF